MFISAKRCLFLAVGILKLYSVMSLKVNLISSNALVTFKPVHYFPFERSSLPQTLILVEFKRTRKVN
jgi:hypothetical protein